MMYRAEIIANQSVQEEIISALEANIPDITYTVIPTAYGRGKDDRKLGNSTWPETNFVLFAYIKKDAARVIKAVIAAIKKKFPNEGVKVFFTKGKRV